MDANSESRGGIFSRYLRSNLLSRIMAGLVLGAVVGAILSPFPEAASWFERYAKFFGDIFINLLKMIVVPVVFLSLVGGAASIAPSHLGRVGVKVMIYYLVTSAFAVVIGLVLANLVQPGLGFEVAGDPAVQITSREAPPLSKVLLDIIPTNPLQALARGDILPIIFFAIVFGIGMSMVKDSTNPKIAEAANTLFEVVAAATETMYKIVAGIMHYAPVGVFVLIAIVFAQQGPRAIKELFWVTLTVYIGLALHLFLCYGGILAAYGLSIFKFLGRASQTMITAFVTRTSSGTLPLTLRTTEEKLGAPRSIASFSLPLGATVNMDGTAIYLGVCAMFIGYATGNPLTFDQQVTVALTATLASIGTAGVPGAGAIMLLMVMASIGMPVTAGTAVAAAYAMILGIDALLDMGRTCLNVSGDMIGTMVVAKSERQLNEECWR